tara:strand:- start:411 stop:857 length:447 start_codon:yes stop_codon:yes gene_type:complete
LGGFYPNSYKAKQSKNKYCADCFLPIIIGYIIEDKKNAGKFRECFITGVFEGPRDLFVSSHQQLILWSSKAIECCNQLLAYNFKKAKQTMKLMVMISQKYEETASDMLNKSLIVEGDYLMFVDYLFDKKQTFENHSSGLLDVLKHKKY